MQFGWLNFFYCVKEHRANLEARFLHGSKHRLTSPKELPAKTSRGRVSRDLFEARGFSFGGYVGRLRREMGFSLPLHPVPHLGRLRRFRSASGQETQIFRTTGGFSFGKAQTLVEGVDVKCYMEAEEPLIGSMTKVTDDKTNSGASSASPL